MTKEEAALGLPTSQIPSFVEGKFDCSRWIDMRNKAWTGKIFAEGIFFRKCDVFDKSLKEMLENTIMNLKFEFPAHNSKQLIQNSNSE